MGGLKSSFRVFYKMVQKTWVNFLANPIYSISFNNIMENNLKKYITRSLCYIPILQINYTSIRKNFYVFWSLISFFLHFPVCIHMCSFTPKRESEWGWDGWRERETEDPVRFFSWRWRVDFYTEVSQWYQEIHLRDFFKN